MRLVTFLVVLIICGCAQSDQSIFSPSGKRIPVSLIEQTLAESTDTKANPSRVLYEITDSHRLVGYNLEIDILKETERIFSNPPTSGFTYVLNGKVQSNFVPKTHIRVGAGLTFVYGKGDEIVGVWGDSLNLKPLHRIKFPGVLINTRPQIASRKSDDMRFAPIAERIALNPSVLNTTVRQPGSCASGTTHYFELAVAYDNTFCEMFDNEERFASAMIQSLVDASNSWFKRDTCVEVVLVYIDGHCNDPRDPYRKFSDVSAIEENNCSPAAPPTEICEPDDLIRERFRKYWYTTQSRIHRDGALFISGFTDGTSTVGNAFIGSACDKKMAYGWVEGINFKTFAHEIGHFLNARHTSEGIMKQGMVPKLFFNNVSASEISAFVDSPLISCVTPLAPRCDASCPGRCLDNKCVIGTRIARGLVPCTPINGFYRCTTRLFGGFYFSAPCTEDYKFVLRNRDPDDVSVFCCLPTRDRSTKIIVHTRTRLTTVVVTNEDGSTMTMDNYFSNQKAVENKYVLNTRIVKDCTLPVLQKCGQSFPRGFSFACKNATRLGHLAVDTVGSVKMVLIQRAGMFVWKMDAGSLLIRRYSVILATSGRIPRQSVGTGLSDTTDASVVRGRVSPFSLILVPGTRTCCNASLYMYVYVELCNKTGTKCREAYGRFVHKMICSRVCRNRETVLPFSRTETCPECR